MLGLDKPPGRAIPEDPDIDSELFDSKGRRLCYKSIILTLA